MAEIHVLSVARLDAAHLDQLSAELSKVHTAGVDLGSRSEHIETITNGIEQGCEQLRADTKILVAQFIELGIPHEEFETMLRTLAKSIENMIEHARTSAPTI
ncbi:hypothetical protein ACQVP2_30545 [Methylobacterium aquaticum]|jgi:hypothetical protein|uniref:hypothetical protein n=1 Tax=Methylobacterium aquaticum TaxID=270351 RepID=UPI003D16655F